MCEATSKQVSFICYMVRSNFSKALPDIYRVVARGEEFVNVNVGRQLFEEAVQRHLTKHEASKIIYLFREDRDVEALTILKKIYPAIRM